MTRQKNGSLVVIGGAEDKEGDCKILHRFFRLCGGREARIIILSTASTDPGAGEQYGAIFTDFGADDVRILAVSSRKEANHGEFKQIVADCSGIFFTGGDQLRITGILGGSRLGDALRHAHDRGAVVAGTSAGASVMSETMLVGGVDDATPKKEIIRMAPGLGLLRQVVIDQHFAQRGRIGRLLSAVAYNPEMLGAGIDEDTALLISEDGVCEVVGSGTVTIIDGRNVAHSNISESRPGQPLALTNICLHILAEQYCFHLNKRNVFLPETKEETGR
ncbi:MAG: cyanophycinase [Clostridium sp.]|nr:cyanophycinase [Clostridium sp.]